MWRGAGRPSHSVGAVDSSTMGWAIQLRGSASTAWRMASVSSAVAWVPM